MQARKALTQILSDRSGLSAERAVELGFAHSILTSTKQTAHV